MRFNSRSRKTVALQSLKRRTLLAEGHLLSEKDSSRRCATVYAGTQVEASSCFKKSEKPPIARACLRALVHTTERGDQAIEALIACSACTSATSSLQVTAGNPPHC